jgi:RsiW-degrading membrane proteinase PrsW (M82 family)
VSAVLVIAALMSAGYAVEMLIDLARPRFEPTEPALMVFAPHSAAVTRVVFWLVLTSWLVAAVTVPIRVARTRGRQPDRRARLLGIAATVAFLLPFTISPVFHLATGLKAVLACLPSTAFALWAVRRMQPYRRIPAWLLLAAAGWGLLIASGFGGALNDWSGDYAIAFFHNAGDLFRIRQQADTLRFLNAGIVEELGKGAGILIAYLVLRRYLDDVVSGLVLGAAVGLGFNFVETVVYMSQQGGSAAFQYWMRQSVGLMAAHTAFTAIVGASIGAARQLPDRRLRRLTVTCALLAAIGGHFASDAILQWYNRVSGQFLAPGSVLDMLVVWPLALILLQGPFVAVYALLVRNGRRSQTASLTEALNAEADSGFGAVTAAEVPVLLNPARRLWLQVTLLRRNGVAAYRAISRLHAAQYDLATQRWHQTRGESADLEPLRDRIRRVRDELASTVTAGQTSPTEGWT